jgi:hypothetical protein
MQQFIRAPRTYYCSNTLADVNQYRAVVRDDSNEMGCKLPTGAGLTTEDEFVGVTMETKLVATFNPIGPLAVQTDGIARAIAASAINVDEAVTIDGVTGKFKAATNATPTSTVICGYARTAALVDGDMFSLEISRKTVTV